MDTAYRVSPLTSADPACLGDYQLVGRLGVGGMGVVYLAEDDDGRHAAVKLIQPALAADPEFSGRFRSEVERARQVPSFCTAEYLDADLEHDPPYLVVEYVDGPSLEEVVNERGPLLGGALHSLAVGVATALTGIHGAGVIHRDLKPGNVLLPRSGPKVIDFGLARAFVTTSRFTSTDMRVGTVAYMAPERFAEDPDVPISAAADVFAWGCVITYAGTARTPFRGDSPSATAARILTQEPRLDGVPEPLRRIVGLALAKEPDDRPTAPQLLAMLLGEQPVPEATCGPGPEADHPHDVDAAAGDGPTKRLVASRRGGGRRPLVAATILSVLGALAAVGWGVSRDAGRDAEDRTAAPSPIESAAALPSRAVPASPLPSVTAIAEVSPPARPSTSSPSPSHRSPAAGTRTAKDAVPQAAINASGRNLALGVPVEASSAEGVSRSPLRAVDGDLSTRWGSEWSDPQWLRVDLGARWQVNEVVLRWERAYAVSYQVDVSADGTTWSRVFATASGTGGTVTVPVAELPARFVRLTGTQRAGRYGYSLYEIEVR
ncbi:protein kinase [Micromonospora sp. HUAS LYJ1]|uniref:protein kinase domain-containing protein n=1 Tax=Micromonospora sp. HUAS LYJ1 TaxID=3061626 RepID=UPI00267377D4|nr:protein kinase [Micromonospora sp. HUAS LYJ1]WKU05338.1 protein kinase [Micromonospora sp. HUAS LYJ1]